MRCPICTQALEGGELVMVCNFCHKSLGGGLNVGTTGEFKVPSPEMLDAALHEPGEQVRSTNVCSWCGKLEAEVKKLLGRSGTALCNECVALAADIMDAELGDGWR
jgi:ribosomal protein L37AE/L43A